MKNKLKLILQKLLGYHNYLLVFSNFKIATLRQDHKEKDFFSFMSAIDKKGVILDIGANLGIMTAHLSRRFPKETIHAFEPEPNNLAILHKIVNSKKLDNVEIHPIALGDKNTTLEMVLPKNGQVKMQGLSHVVHPSIKEWNEGDTFKVQSNKLDDLDLPPVAGIKMDVENFEIFVLKGAAEIIRRDHPVIYLELWENENRDQCFAFLEQLEYQAYVVDQNNLVPYNPLEHHKQNFIFR